MNRKVIFRPLLLSADVLARLPSDLPAPIATTDRPTTKTATASWIIAEAQRLKAAGKIPEDISKTDLAKLFEAEMSKAAKRNTTLSRVGWRHIKNQLPAWDLWPLSKIK